MEEILLSRYNLSEIMPADDDLKTSRRTSGSAGVRRSFFRRKRHQRNSSKDSREFNSYSDVSLNSDSLSFLYGMCSQFSYPTIFINFHNARDIVILFSYEFCGCLDGSLMAYQRVERLECKNTVSY